MNPDAFIFDLDGLLLDTESYSMKAFQDTAEAYGLEDKLDLFLSLVGTNEVTHRQRLAETLEPEIDSTTFRNDWTERFLQAIKQKPPGLLPGVTEMLDWLVSENIKRAVATSSRTVDGEKKLKNAGIRDYFSIVICGDQVEHSKPAPDIYLKAGADLGADMQRSIGLEDSANGVRAAHAAGLNVIQIPNLVPPAAELKALDFKVCESMHDVLSLAREGRLLS